MKRYLTHMLVGCFLLQLLIPGYLVLRHYDTLHSGTAFRFQVEPYDPYDPFRGRYVALYVPAPPHGEGEGYALLEVDEEGYAQVAGWQATPPAQGAYAKDLQLDRYYMDERLAPKAERLQRELDMEEHTMYLLVRVKDGHYVIQGLYLDDVPIESYLTA